MRLIPPKNLQLLRTSAIDHIANYTSLYITLHLLVCVLHTFGYPNTTRTAIFYATLLLASRHNPYRNVVWLMVLILALFCTNFIEGAFFMVGFCVGKVQFGYRFGVQGGRGE
ncbi:hypothetical protein EJ02DRAFT_58852 [Clathrospora elynae]|uniref:Uncharacterized protein n=1 Tax=Clathrospora elynae TaxID=706981 RepID=A0A6A5T0G4_9PLEO|nr:hypothetical protein EJ02DRAFT_58852 [Clathrospora elynae]